VDGSTEKLLLRIEKAWRELADSYTGLTDAELTEPGASGDWSVKDVIAHVTTWEKEALQHLPTVARGGRPPRYASVGGIDAFNARAFAQNRDLPLQAVLERSKGVHARLVAYVASVEPERLANRERFVSRLRLDTYGHYRIHSAAIRSRRSNDI
jgi:hypothetical protein